MVMLYKTITKKVLKVIAESFISKYATSHPWEDWAETWAHYLHIMDMVETAYFFGLNVKPIGKTKEMKTKASFDPYITSKILKSLLKPVCRYLLL
jgi:hypothetical protein